MDEQSNTSEISKGGQVQHDMPVEKTTRARQIQSVATSHAFFVLRQLNS
jgi:hypothetical protein